MESEGLGQWDRGRLEIPDDIALGQPPGRVGALDRITGAEPRFHFGPQLGAHCEKLTVPPTGSGSGALAGGVSVPDQAIEPHVTEMGEAYDSAALTAPRMQSHGQYW